MFGSISPYKQLQSPKGDNKKPIEEIRRIRSGLSTSPRGLTSPSKQGKKIEETGPVHIEVTQDDHSDRPRFPIRIPVEQMKPKRDYLAQVRKSDTTLDSRPSTAKQVKTEVYTKSGPRRTSETAKGKSPKDVKSLNKRNSMSRNEKPKQAGNLGNTAVDAQDLKKIIENIVDYKFRTYAGASNRALETQKSASNLSMDMSMRKRPNSSRRPMSSRASNKKPKNTASMHRAASSKKEVKETEYSRMSQPPEPLDPEEAKKEKHERMKKIVIENLKKFSNQQKEKEQKKVEEDQGKTLKKEALKRMNERIKMKNEISPPNPTTNIQKSLSPVKHKYEWGADQKRLEMKPERKQSAKKWEKKDPEARRQEIGLSHLNNLEDIALKKAKIESKEKAEKIMKEAEEKYKLTRKEKTTEEKEKLKLLIHEQIEKKKKEKLDEKAKALQEKELKKKRLEALFKDVAEIQAKDLAEKKEAEKNKPKKPIKKKSKKTSEIGGSTNSLPDEDIAMNVNRGRGKRPSEIEAEEEYEEEIVEEEGNDEVRELNEDDLYLLDELFEKLDIRMEEELVKGGFKKLKAYCFSEQMNRKVAQEKAAIQQKQKQQQQQLEKQQQLQLKQQQQQQQQSQTQQAGKGKVSFTATSSGQKEKAVEPEKMSSQKQRLVESEKKQQKVFAPANDFDVEDNEEEEEEQEVYISKPLKESNNYSKGLPPKQSIVEKGKQRSDTSGKKMDFRDDKDEGTGYRIYNQKSADKYKNQMMKENTRKDEGVKIPEGVDFDEMLFNLSSEELIKLPYFSIVK